MAENYKLVSEDEWQAMVDRAEVAEGWHEHWRDVAERWKDRAELAEKSERQLAAVLDQKADREEPVEVLSKDNPARQRNGEKNWLWRYDVDGNLIWSGPPELAPAFGEFETGTRDNADHFEYVTENGARTPIERPRKVKWYEQDEPRPLPPYMGPEPCEHLTEARDAGPQTTVSSTSESAQNFIYAFPQRPHESLVWAILFAQQVPGASSVKREILMENAINNADKLLDTWRARWPESTD